MTQNKEASALQSTQSVADCCTILYSHPLASWLIGESLHPGGLALTDVLADIAEIGIDSRVLDVGCGHGSSSVHLAARRGCEVFGITLEAAGIVAAQKRAEAQGLSDVVCFEQADVHEYDAPSGRFDTVLMECVLSTLDRKHEALKRLNQLLTPGGRIALSDVTVRGELPEALSGVVASALCIGDALRLDEYVELVQSAGFRIITAEDVRDVAAQFVKRIRTALMMADVAVGLGKLNVSKESIKHVRDLIRVAQDSVEEDLLSYSIIVAEKAV